MKHIILLFAFAGALFSCAPTSQNENIEKENQNCFAIIAGREATADGSVLFGHNEDDSGEQMLNVYVCNPSLSSHFETPDIPKFEGVKPETRKPAITNGIANLEGKQNLKFIWVEFPGMSVADAFMNEYGVAIASDGCNSKEDINDVTDGGILYGIRVSVAKYARSAQDAVEIIGDLVERYGYAGSGRTYCIADPYEAWIVAVVMGRHWVAQRVPDDKVMIIPNYYAITKVDLKDSANFLGSADIVDYAIKRGWYNPQTDGEFNFRVAYSSEKQLYGKGNTGRHEKALAYFTDGTYPYSNLTAEPMITPAHKVSMQDMINALSIHDPQGNVKGHNGSICNGSTVVSTIFQLRPYPDRERGCIMWMAPGKPCMTPYVPWYLGLSESPKEWRRYDTWQEAEAKHFTHTFNKRISCPNEKYWEYVGFYQKYKSDYTANAEELTAKRNMRQQEIFSLQKQLEKDMENASPEERREKMIKLLF